MAGPDANETTRMRGITVPLTAFAGGRLFGERLGSGPPRVIGLHGWGRDRTDMARVLAGLDAIVIDLPGFGASPPPPDAWGAGAYAEAITPVLEEFAEPPVLVGHSFGGRVAVCLAAADPNRVRALILTGVPLLRRRDARRPPPRYRAVRALHRAGLVSEARMERARVRHGSRDYRAASGVMRGVLVRAVNESYEEQLRMIRSPVEMVWGGADAEVPLEIAERAAPLLSDARITVIPGADHFIPLRSSELREAIEKHLP
jgi:pimeloyl-ACP methyl ester carboxylesterase